MQRALDCPTVIMGVLGCETLAAFGATAVENQATFGGSHTGTETVGALTLLYTGLKCSFHG